MIGYYVHHQGHGHLSHALSICAELGEPVTILSSLCKPADWQGHWLSLPRDDLGSGPTDPTARGELHWAPIGDENFQDRMARIADWIVRTRPAALLVDVSVEVCVLARTMGVPVVTMALPGDRGDRAHRLGYALSDAIIAPWFARFAQLCPELRRYSDKVHYVGAISRYDQRPRLSLEENPQRRVLVLQGAGGICEQFDLAAATTATKPWNWEQLGPENWSDDPWDDICHADVVITNAGLSALGEIAAAGKPAIVIPQPRPHDEQLATAAALDEAHLAVVCPSWPSISEWPGLLQAAVDLGGSGWSSWSSGDGARTAAQILVAAAQRRSEQR